jgi:hypothetical protein
MLWLWYYRRKYKLLRRPAQLVDRAQIHRRDDLRSNALTLFVAFVIACLTVALFHFVTYGM